MLGKSTRSYFTTPDIFYLGLDYDRIVTDSRKGYEIVFEFCKFNFLSLSHCGSRLYGELASLAGSFTIGLLFAMPCRSMNI